MTTYQENLNSRVEKLKATEHHILSLIAKVRALGDQRNALDAKITEIENEITDLDNSLVLGYKSLASFLRESS